MIRRRRPKGLRSDESHWLGADEHSWLKGGQECKSSDGLGVGIDTFNASIGDSARRLIRGLYRSM